MVVKSEDEESVLGFVYALLLGTIKIQKNVLDQKKTSTLP